MPQVAPTAVGIIFEVRHSTILAFTFNPRKSFEIEALKQLASSIRAVGQRTPILVRTLTEKERVDHPGKEYQLVDGERRYRACAMIGKEIMRAQLANYSDGVVGQRLDSIIANICREDHTPIETAEAIQWMTTPVAEGGRGMTVAEAADALGKGSAWAYQHLNLLRLDKALQQRMGADVPPSKRLNFQLGLKLSRLPKPVQKEIANEVVGKGHGWKRMLELADRTANRMGFAPTMGRPRAERDDFRALSEGAYGTQKTLLSLCDFHESDFKKALAGKSLASIAQIQRVFKDVERMAGAIARYIERNKP
jgi:ParB/RepB/Spo0J family partition protein